MVTTPGGETSLNDLRYHWGEAYLINRRSGRWTAERRDSRATVSAGSAEDLLKVIYADYAAQPVSRDASSS
jgi:hypothetical protein